jgi:hypothetical protein
MVEVVATTKPKVQPNVGTHDQTGRRLTVVTTGVKVTAKAVGAVAEAVIPD